MHGSAEVWALVSEGNGKSFRFRCHVLPVTLLLLFFSLLSPFLVRVVAAQCPLAFCFDDNLLHSLSLVFSRSFLNLKLLCLRGQGSDFSVKITLFQLLTRTQLHSYFAPVLLPLMNEIKMHLHQHYRRTCRKKLVFGLLGWALLLLRRRTHCFRQQNQYTLTTPSMTMMTVGASLLTFWDAGARERGIERPTARVDNLHKNLR